MTRKHILFGGTSRTPAEQRLGRLLRAPDGHPDVGAGAGEGASHVAPPPGVVLVDVPDTPPADKTPATAPTEPSVDDLYEQEFGIAAADVDGKGDAGDGEGTPPEPEKAAEPTEAEKAEARAKAAEERAAKAERELELAKKGKETNTDDSAPAQQPSDPQPKAEDYEFGEADSKYLDARSAWVARQEFYRLQEQSNMTAQVRGIETAYNDDVAAPDTLEEYPDFVEKVTKGADRGDWACTKEMAIAIKASPVGKHLAYELASNPEESDRIASLPLVAQAYELGILEGKIRGGRAAKANVTKAPPPAPKVSSSAPPPPAAKSRGAGGQFVSNDDALYDKLLGELR